MVVFSPVGAKHNLLHVHSLHGSHTTQKQLHGLAVVHMTRSGRYAVAFVAVLLIICPWCLLVAGTIASLCCDCAPTELAFTCSNALQVAARSQPVRLHTQRSDRRTLVAVKASQATASTEQQVGASL